MTPAPASHPPPERLRDFGLGQLGESDSALVESHLNECADCRRAVEELPADPLVELLQKSAAQEPTAKPPSLPGLYKRLAAILKPGGAARPAGDLPAELKDHPRYQLIAQ